MEPPTRPGAETKGDDPEWSLIDGTICWNQIPACKSDQIRDLILTNTNSMKRELRELCKQKWHLAQLFLYDIWDRSNPFGHDKTSTESSLRALLLWAVSQGWCEKLPQSVRKIEKQLQVKRDWELAQYEQQMEIYTRAKEQRAQEDKEWAELARKPGLQANLNLDRFMEEYFLTDGKPNRENVKAHRLDGLGDHSELIRRARKNGLHTLWTDEPEKLLCIGWDESKVQYLVNFTNDKVREKGEQKRAAEEAEMMDAHHKISAHRRELEKTGRAPRWKIGGVYLVTITEIRKRFPGLQHPFKLEISDVTIRCPAGYGQLAGYDFGIVEGSMLLGASSAVMDGLVEKYDSEYQASLAKAADTPGKRKTPPTLAHLAHNNKRVSHHPPPSNLHHEVRIRGRETVEGKNRIFHHPRSGHINFMNKSFTVFTGEVYLGMDIGAVKVKGHIISADARKCPEEWNSFVEAALTPEQKALGAGETPKKSKKSKKQFTTPNAAKTPGKRRHSSSKKNKA